jgi:apocytochrome f
LIIFCCWSNCWKNTSRINFPCCCTRSRKKFRCKIFNLSNYAGGNRGRGQVYPTGEKSNVNIFGATQAGQITEITTSDKGTNIVIVSSNGTKTSQVVPAGLTLIVKQGDTVQLDQALNADPNVGGFGQEESEIVLQNPIRIFGYLAFCFSVLLTQVTLILKKKQFEKVQAAELNF